MFNLNTPYAENSRLNSTLSLVFPEDNSLQIINYINSMIQREAAIKLQTFFRPIINDLRFWRSIDEIDDLSLETIDLNELDNMFGSEYSSDVTGDGPSSKEAARQKFIRSVTQKKKALIKQAKIDKSKLKKSQMGPQSFITLPIYTKLVDHLRTSASDIVVDKIEGLCALFFALIECSSKSQFLAIATLYAKTHCNKSLTKELQPLIDSLFGIAPQGSSPAWLDVLTDNLSNWKLITSNPAFSKISKIISMMVAIGIFDKDAVDIKVGSLSVFSTAAIQRQVTAVDLLDAVAETVVFFAEGAYLCFTEGSLKPLLYSTSNLTSLEEKYIDMRRMWEHARNGNLKRFLDIDEAFFAKSLEQLVSDYHELYKTTTSGAEKKILFDRWRELSAIETEFTASRVQGGLRVAPFPLKIFGESSVGKSTFTDYLMCALLRANGYEASDDYIITLNPDDKHMSNMRSYVNGIKIDDYGNTKMEFVDLAPSDWLIQICNNIKRYAVMADLANKGKISIQPAIVTITTNVEDLLAHQTSNEPVSIGRRCEVHLDLKVRPEFCKKNADGSLSHMLDPLKVFEKYGESDEIQDIWLVTVRNLVIDPNDCGGTRRAPAFHFEDHPDFTRVSIFDILDYCIAASKKHFLVQNAVVHQQTNLSERMPWCTECNRPSQVCTCEIEPQFGLRIANLVSTTASKWSVPLSRTTRRVEAQIEDVATDYMIKALRYFEESPYALWTSYLPNSWLANDYVRTFVYMIDADFIEEKATSNVKSTLFLLVLFNLFVCTVSPLFAVFTFMISLFAFMLYYASVVEHTKSAYYQAIMDRNDAMPEMFKKVREDHMKYLCGSIAGFGVLWGLYQTYKALRSVTSFQGNLKPVSIQEITARDSEVNPWNQTTYAHPSVEANVSQMSMWADRLESAQWHLTIHKGEAVQHSNAFSVTTNVLLIPNHMVPSEVRTCKAVQAGKVVTFLLDPTKVVKHPSSDLAMIYVPNLGDRKDMLKYFADGFPEQRVFSQMYYRTEEDSMMEDSTWWKHQNDVFNGVESFSGSFYKLHQNTFGGLCMATFVANSGSKYILGFHLGGITDTPNGCAAAVTRGDITFMLSALYQKSITHMKLPAAAEFPEEILKTKFTADGGLHKKSPVNWLPADAAITAFGNVQGRSTFKSSVIRTPISEIVTDITGVDNVWDAPKFEMPLERPDGSINLQTYRPWSESLQHCCKPSIGFPASDVDLAAEDYLSDLKDLYSLQGEAFWDAEMKPLDDIQTISGVDGRRFVDSMPAGTSIGFPIGGAKRKHLIDLEEEIEGVSAPRIFTPVIMEEYHNMLDTLAAGERTYQIFGSSLKDEPTPVSKDKVRVFQAAPVCLQMGIRKFFLPIARFLSMNPLVAECAVGINSHGPEWEQLAEHMRSFGEDRVIAGDYSKYDLRMPAQLVLTAFQVMIEIATWSKNYSPRDLRIMQGLALEVAHPCVAFNGDLLMFHGTNPSGQNMTVYVNSIVNSLLHRLGFFSVYSVRELNTIAPDLQQALGRDLRFRDIVALATYGDDAKGSVRQGFDKFTHITFANYLAENDMKFTMPDKHSDPVHFMSDQQADFLKRKNRFDTDLGHTVGMLEEASIFKSLHSILRSKVVSPEEVSYQNLQGALREWFYYGRDHFDMRRNQVGLIAIRAGFEPAEVQGLDYDGRVSEWKLKYDRQ